MNKFFLLSFLVGVLLIFLYSSAQTNLVGYWKFDEGSGSIAYDSSGNNNHGTIYSATWISNCKSNYCLSFDGANDYVEVADNGGLDNIPQITLVAWFKLNQLASAKGEMEFIVAKKHSVSPWSSYFMGITTANNFQFSLLNSAQGQASATSTSTFQAGVWYFVACTYDGSSMKIYVNGDPSASAVQTGSIFDSNYPFRIGADWSGGSRMNGTIDDVRVYNYALTADEIKALYSSAVNIYGKLTDKDGVPLQAKITVYEAGTNTLNASNQTDSNGNYNLAVSPRTYDVQFNLTNFFIQNFWIKLLSINLSSDISNLVNYVTWNSSANKTSFTVNVNNYQSLQVYSQPKPNRVLVNGTALTEVSSLSNLGDNTWYYNQSGGKLYMISNYTTTPTTTTTTTTTGPATGLSWLHTSGTKIYDSSGKEVKLWGAVIQTGDSTTYTQSDMQAIKNMGFNAIRIWVYWGQAEPSSSTVISTSQFTSTPFQIDNMVQWATNAGLYVIITVGGTQWWHIPSWVPTGNIYLTSNGGYFSFTDSSTLTGVANLYAFMANRYKDYPNVIFEGLNEMVGSDYTNFRTWNNNWVSAVEANEGSNSHLKIIEFLVGGTTSTFNLYPPYITGTHNNILMATHDYFLVTSSNPSSVASQLFSACQAVNSPWIDTEFSTAVGGTYSGLQTAIQTMTQTGISGWGYFCYNAPSGSDYSSNWCINNPTNQATLLSMLQPYMIQP